MSPFSSIEWAGLYPGVLTYMQGRCSMFPDASLEPLWPRAKGAGRISGITTCTWPPHLEPLRLTGQCPAYLRQLLSPCLPAWQNHQHTAYADATAPQAPLSTLGEAAVLSNSCKHTQEVQQNERTEDCLSNEGMREFSRGKTLRNRR